MKKGDAVYFDEDGLQGIGMVAGAYDPGMGRLWYFIRIIKCSRGSLSGHDDRSGEECQSGARYWICDRHTLQHIEHWRIPAYCNWCTEQDRQDLVIQAFNT